MPVITLYVLIRFAVASGAQPNAVCSDLLAQAANLQSQLPLDERADVLARLADAAATADPARANEWALQLFYLTQQMPPGQNRAATQKQALTLLAVNDPERALKLYRQQDLPLSWEHPPDAVEDPRALGRIIFNAVWERPDHERYLPKLVSLAKYLGSTGQYPYAAMARIATDIAKTNAKAARRIISDATRYYRLDPGFQSSPLQFVQFVSRTWKLATSRQLRQATEAATDAILRMQEDPGGRHFHLEVQTDVGSATFDSQRAYLLFRLLPYLRQAQSRRVDAVLRLYPGLRNTPAIGPDTAVRMSGSASRGGAVPDPQRVQRALDENRLLQVKLAAADEPARAAKIADEISDPTRRAVADAVLARAFAVQDRSNPTRLLAASESQLAAATGDVKLRLAGYLSAGYFAVGDPVRAEPLLRQSVEIVSEIAPAARRDTLVDAGEIVETAVMAGADPSRVAEMASTVADAGLRDIILVAAAKAACRLR